MLNEDYKDYDAERGFISCCRDEECESTYEIWAYALDHGISDNHFTDNGIREYFQALKLADREDDFGFTGAMLRLPKEWKEANPNFIQHVIMCCETNVKGKEWVDRLVKAQKFRKLKAWIKIIDDVAEAGKLDDPTKIAIRLDDELSKMIEPNTKTLVSAKELAEATNLAVNGTRARWCEYSNKHRFLNKILDGGFRAGQMVVVAARPSIGKTTFSMNIASAGYATKKICFSVLRCQTTNLVKNSPPLPRVNLSKFAEDKTRKRIAGNYRLDLRIFRSFQFGWMMTRTNNFQDTCPSKNNEQKA